MRLLIDLAVDQVPRDNVSALVLLCGLAPGVGRLPEQSVPPRRTYTEEHDAVLIVDDDDDEESMEVLIVEDPEDDDAPEIQIVEDRPATDAGKRRRPDETIVHKRKP